MKTGFTCPAGFNVVATATQGNRHLLVVVLGAPSPLERTMEAGRLFDAGFAKWGGGEGSPESLPDSAVQAAPPTCAARSVRAAIAPPCSPPKKTTAARPPTTPAMAARGRCSRRRRRA